MALRQTQEPETIPERAPGADVARKPMLKAAGADDGDARRHFPEQILIHGLRGLGVIDGQDRDLPTRPRERSHSCQHKYGFGVSLGWKGVRDQQETLHRGSSSAMLFSWNHWCV